MLVVKAVKSTGSSEPAKEIGRLKIISQNPFDLSGNQISSYTYEMADPRTASFPLKGVGRIANHFRQQSVWMLVEKAVRDMNARGLFAPYQHTEPIQDAHTIDVSVELWDGGDESMSSEIGCLKFTAQDGQYVYKLSDPGTSNLALKGGGTIKGNFAQQPFWALLEKTLADMHARNLLATPADETYAAAGHAWLKTALAAPGDSGEIANATTCFRSALNAYTYAFQRTAELTPDLRSTLQILMDNRNAITACGERGINARYAWILNRGFTFCGPGDAMHPALQQAVQESAHFMQRPEPTPAFDKFISSTLGFLRSHLHL